MKAILELLKASDVPDDDQRTFLIAQIFFWLIGATDGHAKNFSVFLAPGGGFRMTPLYDVLSAQPSLDNRQIRHNQLKLAMCAGDNRHYRIDEIQPRHFAETARATKLPTRLVSSAIAHVAKRGKRAFDDVAETLPADFPAGIHDSIKAAALPRIRALEAACE